MNVVFKLRKAKGKKSLIYLTGYIKSKRFIYSTGERILEEFWSNGYPVKRKGRSDLSTLRSKLELLESYVSQAERNHWLNKKPVTNESLKYEIDVLSGKIIEKVADIPKPKKRIKFVDFADKYIKQKISRNQYHKSIQSTVNIIKEIDKNILLDNINAAFYDEFLKHMIKNNYSKNYTGKMTGNIIQVMNEAVDVGATVNNKYKPKKVKRVSEQVYNIYLTVDELTVLHEHDFSEEAYKDNACDLFLIGAFTGMRFSDFSDLEGINFEDGDFVIRDTQKTGSRVIIPQHRIVKEIIKKRGGELPHTISNAKMNEYLKEIGEDAELDTKVIKTITKGGVKERTTYKKYQLLCTHTARRSLATNLYLAGVPVKSIAMLTGHATVKQLMSYIKVTEQEQAKALQDHDFFKKVEKVEEESN